jgi:hypothetical protein
VPEASIVIEPALVPKQVFLGVAVIIVGADPKPTVLLTVVIHLFSLVTVML